MLDALCVSVFKLLLTIVSLQLVEDAGQEFGVRLLLEGPSEPKLDVAEQFELREHSLLLY